MEPEPTVAQSSSVVVLPPPFFLSGTVSWSMLAKPCLERSQ